jgi:hypothetical protein
MFYEYDDDDLVMRLPDYLRPERGMRSFKPYGRGQKERQIFTLAVTLDAEEELAAVIRDAMNRAGPSDWMGVQTRVIRRGPTAYTEGGFEVLLSSYNTTNGDIVNNYSVIFPVGGISSPKFDLMFRSSAPRFPLGFYKIHSPSGPHGDRILYD